MKGMVELAVIFSGVWLASGGCLAAPNYVAGHDCSELIPFFRRPIHDQFAEFMRLDVEKKYWVYLCGNQFVHPPALYLVEPFARDGPNVVIFLRDKLSRASDDLTIRDIVRLFKEMQRQNTYDVA